MLASCCCLRTFLFSEVEDLLSALAFNKETTRNDITGQTEWNKGSIMTEKELTKKQTTVLSADAAGYSRLMCRDETRTVVTLTDYRNIMSELIHRYRGRVVDAVGDNLLAEFGCAVDAVLCAVEIQKELLQLQNVQLPGDKWMRFRIGINYGEVIEVDKRLYGTGVNIAARLESKADPGGICLSREVVQRVRDRLPFKYDYLGEFHVKNICRQVDIFRVNMG